MKERQTRSITAKFKTRSDGEEKRIEGYFAVFDSVYNIAPGLSESIARGAFKNTLKDDIRALVDHDTRLVLGRKSAGTLKLNEDNHGLFGSITINPDDTDAGNLYARVQRGDVTGCSIGFEVLKERTDVKANGDVHWTIEEVKLYEVSVCTFPAYEETNVTARKKDAEAVRNRKGDAWKLMMKERLNGRK